MKKTVLIIILISFTITINAQWIQTGNNSTTGNVTAKEYNFPFINYDFSKMPRTQISPMSIKLFDDYVTYRPGGTSPDSNAYGTLLSIYGRSGHWESNLYFGAVSNKMYFRTSKYSGHVAENGVTGDFNEWRTLLDSKSDLKTSGLLKIESDGNHYLSKGNFGIGTKSPYAKLTLGGDSQVLNFLVNKKLTGTWPAVAENRTMTIQSSGTHGGNLAFATGNEERMRITASGDVGIGTMNPVQKLDVNGAIQAGPQSTHGGIILAQKYGGDDYLGTLSSNYSSGAIILGYGAAGMKNQGSNGQLMSTYDHAAGYRGALRIGAGTLEFLGSDTALQTKVGDELLMSSKLFINTNGDVGIGTTNPKDKLDVGGSIVIKNGHNLSWGNKYGAGVPTIAAVTGAGIYFYPSGSTSGSTMRIDNSGNIGIGTTDTKGFKLGVNGKIAATEVKVATYANWADFVFAKEYKLPTLKEVESYIKKEGHLLNIPSAEEVKKDGFFLGEMNAKLLQKIEELTLYTIQQEKEIDALKTQKIAVEKVTEENKDLKKRLEKLEKLVNKLL